MTSLPSGKIVFCSKEQNMWTSKERWEKISRDNTKIPLSDTAANWRRPLALHEDEPQDASRALKWPETASIAIARAQASQHRTQQDEGRRRRTKQHRKWYDNSAYLRDRSCAALEPKRIRFAHIFSPPMNSKIILLEET